MRISPPRVVLCGNVSVGEGTLIGAGATVIPGIKIGKWVTIGAGAVVVKDIPDYAVAVGNPAKVIKVKSI
jgi:acetyltransferase EpsM